MKTNFIIVLYLLTLQCHSEEDCKFDQTGKCKLKSLGETDEFQDLEIIMSRINEVENKLLNTFSHLDENCETHKEIDENAVNGPASYLLDAMNPDVDPCEDFYEFSCGKWIQYHPGLWSILEEYKKLQKMMIKSLNSEVNNIDLPASIRKIMQAYTVCKNYDGVTGSILDWLKMKLMDIGGWPLIGNYWYEIEWKILFTKAFRNIGSLILNKGPIAVFVTTNPVDTTSNIIQLGQPEVHSAKSIDKRSVTKLAELFSNKNNVTLHEEMKNVAWLEQLLLTLSKPVLNVIGTNESKIMTIENLERIIPTIDWVHFLRNILRPYLQSTSIITKDTNVYVVGITYLKTIVADLDSGTIPTKTVANYIASTFISSFVEMFPPILSNGESKINTTRQEERCFLGFSGIYSFIDYVYNKHRKEKTVDRKMITYILDASREMIGESEWLDQPTKEKVKEKLDAMVLVKDFPQWTIDAKHLDEYFKYLPSMTRNPFENKLNIENYIYSKDSQLLTVKNDRNDWPRFSNFGGFVPNAFNNVDQNQIVIPAGIQNLPYFDPERPAYLNFGGLGLVVGHEITHGFDKLGSQRDKYGNERNWWTDRSKAEFEKKVQCLVDQYNALDYVGSGYVTVSENIADNGGLRQSYLAMKRWEIDFGVAEPPPGLQDYTIDQLFFLSFARILCDSRNSKEIAVNRTDTHSANKIRVMATLQNMKEFSEVFKCKYGSRMNPINKCIVW